MRRRARNRSARALCIFGPARRYCWARRGRARAACSCAAKAGRLCRGILVRPLGRVHAVAGAVSSQERKVAQACTGEAQQIRRMPRRAAVHRGRGGRRAESLRHRSCDVGPWLPSPDCYRREPTHKTESTQLALSPHLPSPVPSRTPSLTSPAHGMSVSGRGAAIGELNIPAFQLTTIRNGIHRL